MNIWGIRRRECVLGSILICATCAPHLAPAAQVVYNINANGPKEVTAAGVPNQGDVDGSATGTLTLDNGTGSGSTGSATFSLTLSNLDTTTLSGHHIHAAPATTTGNIVLDFGDPDTLRNGNSVSGTISGLSATQITTIFANPSNFYYNVHNTPFPGGAVRDQLVPVPEPGSAFLLLGGVAGLFVRTRRSESP